MKKVYRPYKQPGKTSETRRLPWTIILIGGFLTITVGLSLTLLGVVLVNTVSTGPILIPIIAIIGIGISLHLYFNGLETVFRDFG